MTRGRDRDGRGWRARSPHRSRRRDELGAAEDVRGDDVTKLFLRRWPGCFVARCLGRAHARHAARPTSYATSYMRPASRTSKLNIQAGNATPQGTQRCATAPFLVGCLGAHNMGTSAASCLMEIASNAATTQPSNNTGPRHILFHEKQREKAEKCTQQIPTRGTTRRHRRRPPLTSQRRRRG